MGTETETGDQPTDSPLDYSALLPPKAGAESVPVASPLLPPRNDSTAGTTRLNRALSANIVFLPDGQGGFVQRDANTVSIADESGTVELRKMPGWRVRLFRVLVNVICIVLGMAILALVFWMAINKWF